MRTGNCSKRQTGLTYLTVLIIIAISGVMLARIGVVWSQAAQREKELDLLFVGQAYRQAIMSYYERTPGMIKRYPDTLEELLNDTRYTPPQHYLRKLYRDPVSNRQQFGIITAPEGGVMGVHSLSKLKPIKTSGFEGDDIPFEGAESYSDWKFTFQPRAASLLQVQKR